MKKLSFLAAAALVAFGAATANAQDTTRKESKGEVKTPPTAASVATLIEGSSATISKIGMLKLEAPPNVEFVDVKTFATMEADQTALKTALEKNKDAVKQLQEEIKKHEAVVTALSNHDQKPEPGDIVAADVQENNKLVIYFWKH